ncbi:TMEM165/GDT1 family protein [Actinokineospora iranica]|uniref:GDT1 family protein n=1 Tax=Actinokineospora iranica TaxID=1271860 RepID=A0A1G6P9V5_9PSEU|nr:TMEM165/GDT1 family protein [Actinokineospora iranica]SDC76778.1 Putative Ca2+/H+ antiporter, TMEM165/GDT1 family [Actinokineospora iranica]
MGTALIAFASAFALVFVVELPDKTLVATLILTTRYRAWPVFVGVTAAFAVQCVIAAAFGGVLTLLPDQAVAGIVAVLFAVGAFLLLREGFSEQESDLDEETSAQQTVPFLRAALTSFGVLFAAEWGDASQIATAGLSAKYAAPVWVGLGAWLALVSVAGIAVLVGKKIAERIKPHLIQRVAGVVFAAFALFAAYQALFA